MAERYRQIHPDVTQGSISNQVGQVYAFCRRIQEGDLVVLPLKTQSAIAIGRVTGPYCFRGDLGDAVRHTRPVEWLVTDLPRTALGQDLLHSLGSLLTVCQIKRNNAEARIRAVLAGKPDLACRPIYPSFFPGQSIVDSTNGNGKSDRRLDFLFVAWDCRC